MSARRKNRAKARNLTQTQQSGHRQAESWPTAAPPSVAANDPANLSIGDVLTTEPSGGDVDADPNPPGDDAQRGAKSGYDNSRGNACKGGRRSRVVFPEELAPLIDARTIALMESMAPRDEWQTFLVKEIARASVLVEVCGKRLDEDQVRVHNRIGEYWEIDASRRLDRLIARLPREPQLMVRELERSKQGAEFLVSNFAALGAAVATHNALDSIQLDMLFTLLGVPHELRSGSRKVPQATDGPALAALISRELARLERLLTRTLIPLDRSEQTAALTLGSTYRDKTTRNLRSDESRNLKRLYWAEQALAQVRSGVSPSTIVDPETKRPIVPGAPAAPAPNPASAATPPPPPPTVEDPPSTTRRNLPPLPEGMPLEDRESLLVFAGLLDEIRAAMQGAQKASGQQSERPEPEPGPESGPPPV